ncbi:MAG: hypothetical protein IPM84_25415 [Anaerolineae bacterium]|nr:hypothetical protein [Anaerolineae bacterium]
MIHQPALTARIAEPLRAGIQSAFIDRAIQQVIATEADNTEAELRRLRQKLEQYDSATT